MEPATLYPFPSITINGRSVSLHDILNSREHPHSDFERNTCRFIGEWFSEKNTFDIQTSGSTGAPKKISFTRAQMTESARMTQEALGLRKDDHALICLDTRFIAGQMMLVRCFTTGMRIEAVDPSANPLQQFPASQRFDFTAMVPYQVHAIVRSASARKLDNIKKLIIGGAALDAETRAQIQNFRCACYATYGMTETLSHIALQRLNGATASSYFKTLPHVTIGQDHRGCLTIQAPHLHGLIVTNDLVNLVDANTFEFIGRYDNVINTGGIKVFPEQIEEKIRPVLVSLDIVQETVVTSVPDELLGDKVVLVIEKELPVPKEELIKQVKTVLEKPEVPKDIFVLKEFSYTATGKINRKETRKQLLSLLP